VHKQEGRRMSELEKFIQPVILKFDGHYEFWSMTMENFLRSKEMWQIIEDATFKDLKVKITYFRSLIGRS